MKRDVQQTSIESFRSLKHLSEDQQTVLVFIKAYPGHTDAEYAKMIGKEDPNFVRPRRYELVHDFGLVEFTGEKKIDPDTKKKAMTWRVKQ